MPPSNRATSRSQSNLIHELIQGQYPDLYKSESITPVPKFFPPEQLKDLRKISGLLSCAKIFDKIISEYLIADMAPSRDPAQYGNEKKSQFSII